jgi:hypothetical protein
MCKQERVERQQNIQQQKHKQQPKASEQGKNPTTNCDLNPTDQQHHRMDHRSDHGKRLLHKKDKDALMKEQHARKTTIHTTNEMHKH